MLDIDSMAIANFKLRYLTRKFIITLSILRKLINFVKGSPICLSYQRKCEKTVRLRHF